MVQPNNQIALALDPGMDLDSVEWLDSSSEVSFNRVEDHRTFYVHFPSTLQPGSNHQLRVSYGGKPRVAPNPPWDGGFVWDQTPSGEPWIGVATQTIGAWIWWPNKRSEERRVGKECRLKMQKHHFKQKTAYEMAT